MNFDEILLENVYDLSFTKELYKYLYDKLKDVKQLNISRSFDITPFFPENSNPYDRKVYIHFRVSKLKANDVNQASIAKNNRSITIDIVGRFRFEYYNQSEMKRIFDHEITHALDFLRMKKYEIGKKKLSKIQKNDYENLAYINDEMEFNSAINNIKKYKQQFPVSWEMIKTYPKFMQVLSKISRIDAFKLKIAITNKDLKKRLLSRLTRENLLPPNLER